MGAVRVVDVPVRRVSGCDGLLADGTAVRVRPVEQADQSRLARFFGGLSEETVRRRYFTAGRRMTTADAAIIADVDHDEHEAFLVVGDGEVLGMAQYDRLPGTTDAEVALVVADAWQGRGVGTLLVEHLAEAARQRGIRRFVADVLPDNAAMLGVMRDLGLRVTVVSDRDVAGVTIDLEPDMASAAVVTRREHLSEAASVARLLRPGSVAVVGASRKPGTVGNALLRNVVDGGFTGRLYAVNPHASDIDSVRCYPSVSAIPDQVDLAIVAVPADAVLAAAEDCGRAGVHGLVVVSAGFAETGADGAARQRELVAIARRHGMRVVGPNCVGVVNTDPAIRLNATFAGALPPAGRAAVLSQSGAVGIVLLDAAARAGLGVSTFVSVGNKADVSGNDLLQYWADDPATGVVLVYLESFGNPRKFGRLARALGRRTPIVAVKSGRTPAGRRAASSHTAALASPDDAVDALFRQAGVVRVDTVREMLDVGRVLADQPLPPGRRVAIVGNSGGPGIMAADACATAELDLAELSATTQDRLRALLPPAAAVTNPVDLLASGGPDTYATAVRTLLADDGVDMVVVIYTPTLLADEASVRAAVETAATATGKPVVAAFLSDPAGRPANGFAVPVFGAPEEAVLALGHVARYADWRRRPAGQLVEPAGIDRDAARRVVDTVLSGSPEGRWLDADEAVALVSSYGVPVLPTERVASPDAAVAAAARLGGRVALKAADGALLHKTDVGAVALNLTSPDDVAAAWARIAAVARGVVVQPMAQPGVETIVGVVHDPSFGPQVLLGLGGVTAELLADRALRLVPLTDTDAAGMLRALRGSPLLFGYRGAPPADTAGLEDLLLRVSRLAEDLPEIAELDLNPVVVTPTGATAVDVKIRLARATRPTGEPRRLPPPRPPAE